MDILGVFAAACSTSASLPQLCSPHPQTLRKGSILLRCTGGVAWSVYGALKSDYPLMVASAIVAIIELILCAKRRAALHRSELPDTLPTPTPALNASSPGANEDTPAA